MRLWPRYGPAHILLICSMFVCAALGLALPALANEPVGAKEHMTEKPAPELVDPAAKAEVLNKLGEPSTPPTVGRREIFNGTVFDDLPPSLSSDAAKTALLGRTNVPIYRHNPRQGPDDAPITVIEFSDLGCLTCPDYLNTELHLREKYGDLVRLVHKYLPSNPYSADTLIAFYAKLAQRSGKFWEFRQAVKDIKDPDKVNDSALNDKLLDVGVTLDNSRQEVRYHARDIYRELDADTLQAAKLKLDGPPPMLFVNGVRLGAGVDVDNIDDLINYELTRLHIPLPANVTDDEAAKKPGKTTSAAKKKEH